MLRVGTLETAVADALRRQIIEGSLVGGADLRVRDLAAKFQVSATPVLAALKRLEVEGYVAVNARRGASVSSLSAEDLEELTVMRSALEHYAVGLSVPRADQSTVQAMKRHISETKYLLDAGDPDAYELFEIDRRFHMALYEACGRPTLLAKVQQLRERSMAYMVTAALEIGTHQRASLRTHEVLVREVEAGHTERAALLVEEHISSLRDRVLPILQKRDKEQEGRS